MKETLRYSLSLPYVNVSLLSQLHACGMTVYHGLLLKVALIINSILNSDIVFYTHV